MTKIFKDIIKLNIYSIAACMLPRSAKLQFKRGTKLLKLNKLDAAIIALNKATKNDPTMVKAFSRLGDAMRLKEDTNNAIKYYRMALDIDPNHIQSCLNLANTLLPGIPYEKNLILFHEFIKPKAYIEIGVQTGKSIAVVSDNTVAIGIDPHPRIIFNLTAKTKIYPITSDDFFDKYDVEKEMGSAKVDFAFIDGLHTFEQVLKDFINVEKYARKDTVVCIHDCIPLSDYTAQPDHLTSFWTGDVWKIMPCLTKYRPDLNVFAILTAPSGLGVVTNLDCNSNILKDNFDQIISEYKNMQYPYSNSPANCGFKVTENNWQAIERALAKTNKNDKAA